MKRVAINQSNYIPWKGYFDLIHDVDVFLFYDDVQFTARDWRNRNRIKTPQGLCWLTVPVGSDTNRRICDVNILDAGWQARHLRTLRQWYGRTPHFSTFERFLSEVYVERTWTNLAEMNQHVITRIAADFLGIETAILNAADFGLQSRKQQRILDVLRAVGANAYHSGPAAKAYLDEAQFAAEGIDLVWKDYSQYPEYPQPYPPFEHAVSILDLLFCTGPDAAAHIWRSRAARPVERS